MQSTDPSKFTVSVVLIGLLIILAWQSRRVGYNNKLKNGGLFMYFLQFWWGVLLFFNVSAALGSMYALNYVDLGQDDDTIPVAPKAKKRSSKRASADDSSDEAPVARTPSRTPRSRSRSRGRQ